MPEAAMNEDNQPVPRKDQVRSAGKIPPMQAEAETHNVQEPPDCEFWLRIRRSDPRHQRASLRIDFHWTCPKAGLSSEGGRFRQLRNLSRATMKPAAARQVSEAVPPPFAHAIARSIKADLRRYSRDAAWVGLRFLVKPARFAPKGFLAAHIPAETPGARGPHRPRAAAARWDAHGPRGSHRRSSGSAASS